ncbi:hypothetical protein L5515_017774 [Caenorhabditis briggsae]|uniref:G-protein coupled receptors family 1 profile domain-containing protein n=1 Tax=Caenorhabditis briggsae TaxID=6238 RepID=A0AAE9FFD5_CAEBR|nr:hypothetical protein L5515_017774 [Caenorhabditis briggsae]
MAIRWKSESLTRAKDFESIMAWGVFIYIQAALSGSLWTSIASPEGSVSVPTSTVGTITSTTVKPQWEPSPPGNFFVDTFGPNSPLSEYLPVKLCLGIHDVFIALFLVMLILLTIFGNILVVLSVVVYKRMRTFTNILLTSLATADLLVGLIVMPMSLLDLLHNHRWPLGRFLCRMWATSDVLLCTASILNLCVISLDRYFAITSPLKYPRTRSRKMAAGLLTGVWTISFVVCSPPWVVPSWNLFTDNNNNTGSSEDFKCAYSPSVAYRIYSALGSFYLPLLVMLFVYFKIFRVASEREALMRQSVGTCRLSNRLTKTQQKNQRNNLRTASAPHSRTRVQVNHNCGRVNYSVRPMEYANRLENSLKPNHERFDSTDCEDSPPNGDSLEAGTTCNISMSLVTNSPPNGSQKEAKNSMERECHSLADIVNSADTPVRKNTEVGIAPSLSKRARQCNARLQPNNLLQKAHEHYQINGPGKTVRGSKEKMVYLRERKALKTIGIVVLGFIICWMPFFIMYLVEVFISDPVAESAVYRITSEFFLWLGYSNSVLNPIIYTMYNGDFRRCFRDLLSFGCVQHHRRTMSVKKLHQQSTIF